jgi:dipeptidyl aminopeptidase/acylaminoacyl peptidase
MSHGLPARLLITAGLLHLLSAPAQSQSRGRLPIPENLVAEGITAIPESLAQTVSRYTQYRSAALADWHPSRREMLIVTRFANTTQIHRVKGPGAARTQLTFFDDPVRSASYQPRDGSYFLFTKDREGDEFTQIYRYDVGSGRTTLLTDGGRSQNGGLRWSRTGDRIAYTSTRRNGTDRDVYVMNPADSGSDRLLSRSVGGTWTVTDWSPDDRRLLLLDLVSINKTVLYLADAATGEKTLLTPGKAGDTVAYFNPRFAADGKGIFLTTDLGSEFSRLAYLDLATRAITPITTAIEHDVTDLELSPDGRTIAFLVNDEGISRLYLMDTRSRRYRQVQRIPLGGLSGLAWHPAGRLLGFTLSTVRSSGDVYSFDLATQRLTRWTESETGGLDTSSLPEPTLIRWTSFDGREISGFYYRPPAGFSGKRPVMIDIHGGPESQAKPEFLGRDNYFLLELGVALIAPNVRGSTGYGKTFTKLDNGTKRLDSVRDIGALLDWIARQPELDSSRVMVTGGSYGGYMTLAVATQYDDRIRCSLDVVGISNFITFLEHTESYRRDARRVEYGDERVPEIRAFFERIAPVNHADAIRKPLFVVQGANDPRVPRIESEQMVATARKNGTPVWYLLGKDEGHGFAKKANRDYLFLATIEFVRRFLLNTG